MNKWDKTCLSPTKFARLSHKVFVYTNFAVNRC